MPIQALLNRRKACAYSTNTTNKFMVFSKAAPNSQFQLCWHTLSTFLKSLYPKDAILINETLIEYNTFWVKHSSSMGEVTGVKVLKALNSVVRRYCLKSKILGKGSLGGIWFACRKDGFPTCLPKLQQLCKVNPHAAIMIGNLYVSVTTQPDYNVSSIEDPFTGTLNSSDIESFGKFVSKELGPVHKVEIPSRLHFTLKSGPNHGFSMLGIIPDASAILMSSASCASRFYEMCRGVGYGSLGEMLMEVIREARDSNSHDYSWFFKSDATLVTRHLAKLAFLPNPGGKTRIVYILNWWHQELLAPLHKLIMSWLKSQPTDGTYAQRTAALTVLEWTKEGSKLYSFDLTAATDRWPRQHQYVVIKALAGDEWAKTWLSVMEIIPFSKELNRFVKYSVGQPMGAFASWGALALTHHMVVRYLAHILNVKPQYVLLGDDIVIKGKPLADAYLNYMTNVLGVKISLAKSFSADNQLEGSAAEFAKCIFHNGRELTPLSPILLSEISHQGYWWKTIDILKWWRNTGGMSVVSTPNWNIVQTSLLNSIKLTLGRGNWLKVLGTVISESETLKSLLGDNKKSTSGCSFIPNPWTKINDVTILTCKMQVLNDVMEETWSNLEKLRQAIQRQTLNISATHFLDLEWNPVHLVLGETDKALKTITNCIANGDHPSDGLDMLTDIDLLITLLSGGCLKQWARDKKNAHLRLRTHRTLKLYNMLLTLAYDEGYNFTTWTPDKPVQHEAVSLVPPRTWFGKPSKHSRNKNRTISNLKNQHSKK